jgi:hypothetical protein
VEEFMSKSSAVIVCCIVTLVLLRVEATTVTCVDSNCYEHLCHGWGNGDSNPNGPPNADVHDPVEAFTGWAPADQGTMYGSRLISVHLAHCDAQCNNAGSNWQTKSFVKKGTWIGDQYGQRCTGGGS